MAAVYNSVSKKKARQLAKEQESDQEDFEMDDFLGDESSDSEDDEEEEEEEEDALTSAKKQLAAGFMPKTRVLMLTSRGVTHRYGANLACEKTIEWTANCAALSAIAICWQTLPLCFLIPTRKPS